MNSEILKYLFDFSAFFTLLNLFIGVLFFKNIKNYSIPFFFLAIIAVTFEILSLIFRSYFSNNLLIFHIYTLLEFSLIATFYIQFYKKYYVIKRSYTIYIGIALICFIDYKLNGHEVMDSISTTTESFVFMTASLVSFYFIMRNLISENIIQLPFFWFNSAILIYFSGNILLFIFSNTLEQEVYFVLWSIIHSLMNIIYNTFISIGFIKTKQA